jgi:hypothetical protein
VRALWIERTLSEENQHAPSRHLDLHPDPVSRDKPTAIADHIEALNAVTEVPRGDDKLEGIGECNLLKYGLASAPGELDESLPWEQLPAGEAHSAGPSKSRRSLGAAGQEKRARRTRL